MCSPIVEHAQLPPVSGWRLRSWTRFALLTSGFVLLAFALLYSRLWTLVLIQNEFAQPVRPHSSVVTNKRLLINLSAESVRLFARGSCGCTSVRLGRDLLSPLSVTEVTTTIDLSDLPAGRWTRWMSITEVFAQRTTVVPEPITVDKR
jgi:hypothetical protein